MARVPIQLSQTHRFVVSTEDPWDTVRKQIQGLLGDTEDSVVKYRDEAGDDVTIRSQWQWEECVRSNFALATGPRAICLYIEPLPLAPTTGLGGGPAEATSTSTQAEFSPASGSQEALPSLVEDMLKWAMDPLPEPSPDPVTSAPRDWRLVEPPGDSLHSLAARVAALEEAAPGCRRLQTALGALTSRVADLERATASTRRQSSQYSELDPVKDPRWGHVAGRKDHLEGWGADWEEVDRRTVERWLVAILMDGADQWRRTLAKCVAHSAERLSLSRNDIGDEGARAVADSLRFNRRLHTIQLDSNGLGDEGARAVADALKFNHSVHSINLKNNGIGDEGARALAVALETNTALESIYLRCNSIGNSGFAALAHACALSSSLKVIYVEDNRIDAKVAKPLIDAVRSKQNVRIWLF